MRSTSLIEYVCCVILQPHGTIGLVLVGYGHWRFPFGLSPLARGPLGALPDGQVALPDGNSAKFEYTLFLACLGPAPAV